MQVKTAFQWIRTNSAMPYPVQIPAGAPVEYSEKTKLFFVSPSHFQGRPIEQHDATYYGCRVDPNNITK